VRGTASITNFVGGVDIHLILLDEQLLIISAERISGTERLRRFDFGWKGWTQHNGNIVDQVAASLLINGYGRWCGYF